ncbi:MAG: metalloregulator ArsR/SmtB family transcription factor [Eubacteriales bacterium]|nr:metalloregulator ArsR/SmtB family transcription factor [Eubacteriales bacterium]
MEIFKALGDENRLRILNILMHHELCVCELEVVLDLSQSNASRHLGKLRQTSIISASKDAQWIHYKVSDRFLKDHKNLAEYLKLMFSEGEIYKNDLNRCIIYKNSVYTCQNITNDRQMVIGYINQSI